MKKSVYPNMKKAIKFLNKEFKKAEKKNKQSKSSVIEVNQNMHTFSTVSSHCYYNNQSSDNLNGICVNYNPDGKPISFENDNRVGNSSNQSYS